MCGLSAKARRVRNGGGGGAEEEEDDDEGDGEKDEEFEEEVDELEEFSGFSLFSLRAETSGEELRRRCSIKGSENAVKFGLKRISEGSCCDVFCSFLRAAPDEDEELSLRLRE